MTLIDELKDLFSSKKIDHVSVQEFIDFELRLYILAHLKNEVLMDDGWSVFTQYFYELTDKPEEQFIKESLYKLRLKNHSFSTQSKWRTLLQAYLEVPKSFRIFDMGSSGRVARITSKYRNTREEDYQRILESLPIEHKREIVRAEVGEDVTYEKNTYSANILDLPGEYIVPLQSYRNKKYITIEKKTDWNQILKSMGHNFSNRPNIHLEILSGQDQLELIGLIHIVGALGAGKSSYKFAQVVVGVKEHGLKIAMIEESVSHVIETVNTLRNLGINAVPLIGSSNERKYLERYLNKFTNYIDISNDEMCKELSGNCFIKALAGDNNTSGFPCSKLYQNNERVSCNYVGSCGHMRRFRKLAQADVIVTTPHNLVKGNLIDPIDPYDRSIYEMLHDLSDMIIIDEADGVQSILEDQLMIDARLNYGDYNIIAQFSRLSEELQQERAPMKHDDKYKFITNLNRLNTVMGVARRVLNKYTSITNYVLNKRLTPIEVFNNIECILAKNQENNKFIEFLREYVAITDVFRISEDEITHRLKEVFNKISSIHLENGRMPEYELKKEILTLIAEYGVKFPTNTTGRKYDGNRITEQICLLVLLVEIDYLVKLLSNEYPYLYYQVYGEMRYIEGFNSLNMKLHHLIKEPCIGTVYGYKISYKNELEIDVVRYEAVGRSMIEHWPYLKEELGMNGPAVICLSGTSHSPGSAHYNLKKQPDILLQGKPEGTIVMHFMPQADQGEYIRVSGSGERKEQQLKTLCNKLIVNIKAELLNKHERKILIVVNSYEDCKLVGEILLFNHMNYRIICNDEVQNSLPREALENFEEESDQADICVVPLNIIARGYNILNESGNSYFETMYFLVRPYMVPGDFSSYIQILHYSMNQIIEDIMMHYKQYNEKITILRKRCFSEFNSILNMSYWKSLTDNQREMMTWFMLVPIKQAIGRMQRNGNSCTVYFCDNAFCDAYGTNEEMTAHNSTLYSFYEVLDKYKGNHVIDSLYSGFYNGLKEMIDRINEQRIEYEMEEY